MKTNIKQLIEDINNLSTEDLKELLKKLNEDIKISNQEKFTKEEIIHSIKFSILDLKSFSDDEIAQAILDGQQIWSLDTGGDGEDDTLIGDYDDIVSELIGFHEFSEDKLPYYWTLDKVDWILGTNSDNK